MVQSLASFQPALLGREIETDLRNQHLLVQLRWVAIAGQVATIAFAQFVLRIDLPLLWMGATLLALLALNGLSLYWLKHNHAPSSAWVLFVDMLLLTVQLGLSGGSANPFTALYLLQVTLAAVLLGSRACWNFIALTALLYGILSLVHLPLRLPDNEPFFPTYLIGMLVALLINSVLIVTFLTQITRNLRDRDMRLAQMREQQAEEDHIVRMGLLASGAAHELGTPLALISVVLSDWRAMPMTRDDPELRHDVAQMQKAVDRCKDIVSDILASSGEVRGAGPAVSSVNAFLDDVVREWTESRGATTLHFENHFGPNVAILTDAAMKPLVNTVLDNALEVSPQRIGLTARRQDNALVLRIDDYGPGFDPAVLARLGKPYNSTKDGLGKGVGLFLVVNAIHKLGGAVSAVNRAGGGATVELRLPLDQLAVGGA